jgi:hypothetical protein
MTNSMSNLILYDKINEYVDIKNLYLVGNNRLDAPESPSLR